MSPQTNTAIGYVRVSTEGQTEGVSLETQEEKLRAWASLYDYTLVSIYRDPGISGRSLRKRPEAQAAIAEARRLKCPLVFYSLSRMVRNLKEAIEILEAVEKAGGSLASVVQKYDTTTVVGWMTFVMEAFFAEIEVRQTSERTKAALAHMKSKGLRIGQVPYGKRLAEDGVSLVDNPDEQEMIACIRNMRDTGLSLRNIQATLSGWNIHPRNGGTWRRSTISAILKNGVNHATK